MQIILLNQIQASNERFKSRQKSLGLVASTSYFRSFAKGSILILENLELNSAILKGLNSMCAAPNFHLTAGEFEDLQQHCR